MCIFTNVVLSNGFVLNLHKYMHTATLWATKYGYGEIKVDVFIYIKHANY